MGKQFDFKDALGASMAGAGLTWLPLQVNEAGKALNTWGEGWAKMWGGPAVQKQYDPSAAEQDYLGASYDSNSGFNQWLRANKITDNSMKQFEKYNAETKAAAAEAARPKAYDPEYQKPVAGGSISYGAPKQTSFASALGM